MASVIKLSDNSTVLDNVISTTYKECLNSGVDLRPGCVGSMMLEVEVYNTQANAVQAGDKLYYYQLDTAGTETLVGVFYAEPKIATKNSYRFVAYDAAQKLNADFSEWLRANQSLFPMTVKTLVQYACTVAGVTLGSTSWTTSGQSVQAFYADGITCRDIVSYAAELAGCFARVHTDESLYIEWYSDTTNKRIYPESGTSGSETRYAYKQDGLQYANYTVPAIDGVAVHPSGEDDVAYIYPSTPSGDNLLHIKNNLLLTGANAAFYNLVAQTVYTQMTAAALGTNGAYVPMTAQLFPRENPYEAGEAVDVTDAQGVSFRSIIMSRTITDAAVTLESTGNETQGEGGNTQKAITQLASDVVRINKLKVDWAEIDTAIINYLTANDVTAQNLTIVDANDNVLATFNANGITFYNNNVAVASYTGNAVVLGEPSQTRAVIDFNSLELYDKGGSVYASIGDSRDEWGYYESTETFTGNGVQTSFTVNFNVYILRNVKINGAYYSGEVSASGKTVTLDHAPPLDSVVDINYYTLDSVYHYDLGKRKSGTSTGAWSVAMGSEVEASANYSAVGGGWKNTASAPQTVVSGGSNNTASNGFASVGGGSGNTASGYSSSVGGGTSNAASGNYATASGGNHNTASGGSSFVGGGGYNTASGSNATVGGGYYNSASGSYNFIGGGNHNTASGASATVCGGEYNEANYQYAAVVGGWHNTASSNGSAVLTGYQNTASGFYASVLGGEGCKATGADQVVFGTYNATDGSKIEIVGKGTADNARSNARTLDRNGNEVLAGTLTATGADFSGTVKVGYGGSGMFFQKTLPAVWTAGTSYYAFRGVDANGNGRGGLQFYRSSANGDGCRLTVANANAVANILTLYVDDSDNRIVAVSEKEPWQKGLGMVYVAGDSVTFGTNSYDRFAGDWRSSTGLRFTIPLCKPVASGVSATVTGGVILCCNGTRTTGVTIGSGGITAAAYITDSGINVAFTYASAPSYAQAYFPVSVQPYNLSITFS